MGLLPFANPPIQKTAVVPGTYTATNLTVNAYGQITAAANGSGGGGGTVTSVSVVTANGVSGTVATASTTPAITLTLGAIVPTSVNGLTITTSTGTLTIANSKTLTIDNSLELAGTDSTKMTFPSTSATIARTDTSQTFTGAQTFSSTIVGSINGNAATVTTIPALTGDITTTGSTNATTLATVNASPSTYTYATLTVNGKGLVTSASSGSAPLTNPMTTLGDIIYENATPAAARLAGNTTSTKNFLVQTGNGSISAAPSWGTIASGDVPTLNQNTTGTANIAGGTLGAIPYQTAANTTGVLGATSTANQVLMSGASAAPVWSTPTYPNASSPTSRKIIVSDGTNWTASTETWAVPGASTHLLQSDGTNWTSVAIPTWNQNTSGTAANLSGTPALPNGTTATTQAAGDNSTDIATDAFVTAAVAAGLQGLSIKDSVQEATTGSETFTILTGNVTTISGTTIDGVSPAVNDRILIKDAPASTGTGSAGSTQPGNGIYVVTANVTNLLVSRSADMSGTVNLPAGAFTYVEGGTVNASSGWTVSVPSTNAAFTYGTNNIKWTQFSGAGEITAGTGLSKSGNTISIENSGVLLPQHGGTGAANNSASTLTISGSFATTLTVTNTTGVTLPTSGTLVSSVSTANGVSATNTAGALSFTLGVITPTSVNGLTLQANSTGWQIAGGTTSKTLTISNSLTLAGTDGTTMTFPSSSDTVVTLGATQTLTSKTLTSPTITGATMNATTIATDTTTGLTIGTATNQKLGFFNATPVVQQAAATDLGTVLSNLGLRVAGAAYPITTSGTVTLTGASNALGTPLTINLTNGSSLPISTGVSGLGTGVATFLATPSSANLLTALTTSTGSGTAVFSASPALTGTPTAPTQTTGDNTTAIATDAFVQSAVTSPNVLQDAFMGSVFQNIDGTTENITLTASEDFIVTRELEIGATKLLEVPATSTLEVESFIDQPFFDNTPSPNVVGGVFDSNEGANVNITLPINTDFISDVVVEISPFYFLEIPNSSTLEVVTYFNQSNPPTNLSPGAITLGYTSYTGGTITTTATSGSPATASSLATTVNIPIGNTRPVKITISGATNNSTAGSSNYIAIWRGTVGSGTLVKGGFVWCGGTVADTLFSMTGIDTPPAGSTQTYNIGWYVTANTGNILGSATEQVLVDVELA